MTEPDDELSEVRAERDYAHVCLNEAHDHIRELEVALREADTACFKLCANHGFATGHGDTIVAMIEEIDAQISARAALNKDAGK